MEIFQIIVVLVLIIGTLFLILIKKHKKYWSSYDIPNAQESFLYTGRDQHYAIFFQSIYKRFRDCGHLFVGCFSVLTPAALVLDLDMIKRVLASDFESFPDRGFYHNTQDDPLSSNLLRLEGEAWRCMRSKLTPTFSSGKMKFMFPTEAAIGDRLVAHLQCLVSSGKTELEMRDLCARFTTDVIGSVAFGIECNSLANPETQFRVVGDKAFACFRPLLENIAAQYPSIFRRFHVTPFTPELIKFYSKIVRETLTLRKEQQIRRNDFMDILIELSKLQTNDGEPMLTLDEIIGQVFLFFIAGYETSSSTMTYCLYELSQNLDIQEKTRADVLNTLKRFEGKLSYECIKEMKYLKKVIDETLRKHPVVPLLRRIVRKRYLVPNTSIYLEKGMHALIPVYALHHDPIYYPQPEKFDPSRFSPEEIEKRHPMCYLPFGAGPRTCIAERFGKMEVQLGIALLVKNFRFTPSDKTPKQLQYDISEKRIFKVKNMFLNVERL